MARHENLENEEARRLLNTASRLIRQGLARDIGDIPSFGRAEIDRINSLLLDIQSKIEKSNRIPGPVQAFFERAALAQPEGSFRRFYGSMIPALNKSPSTIGGPLSSGLARFGSSLSEWGASKGGLIGWAGGQVGDLALNLHNAPERISGAFQTVSGSLLNNISILRSALKSSDMAEAAGATLRGVQELGGGVISKYISGYDTRVKQRIESLRKSGNLTQTSLVAALRSEKSKLGVAKSALGILNFASAGLTIGNLIRSEFEQGANERVRQNDKMSRIYSALFEEEVDPRYMERIATGLKEDNSAGAFADWIGLSQYGSEKSRIQGAQIGANLSLLATKKNARTFGVSSGWVDREVKRRLGSAYDFTGQGVKKQIEHEVLFRRLHQVEASAQEIAEFNTRRMTSGDLFNTIFSDRVFREELVKATENITKTQQTIEKNRQYMIQLAKDNHYDTFPQSVRLHDRYVQDSVDRVYQSQRSRHTVKNED